MQLSAADILTDWGVWQPARTWPASVVSSPALDPMCHDRTIIQFTSGVLVDSRGEDQYARFHELIGAMIVGLMVGHESSYLGGYRIVATSRWF